MARGLRYPLLMALALLCTALAARSWTPGEVSTRGLSPNSTEVRDLAYAIDRASARYVKAARANALVPRMLQDDQRLRIAGMSTTDSMRFAQFLAEEVPAEPRARIAIFQVADTVGLPRRGDTIDAAAARRAASMTNFYAFTGGAGDGAWCMSTISEGGLKWLWREQEFSRRPGQQDKAEVTAAGPCRWWGRYGAPGARLAEFFSGGNLHYLEAEAGALEPRLSSSYYDDIFLRNYGWEGSIWGMRCANGDASSCMRAFEPRQAGRLSGGIDAYSRSYWGAFGYGDVTLFAQVEREFGQQKFQQFWSSQADVETAFASAFGVRFDAWLAKWADTHFGGDFGEPQVDLLSTVLSLLTVALGLLAGATVLQRRSIG